MRVVPRLLTSLASLVVTLSACAGDDGEGSAATSATTSTTAESMTSTEGTTATTSAETTTTSTTTAGETTAATTSTSEATTTTTTESESDTGVDCADLPAGPLAAELVFSPFDGSEDLAFDGLGRLAGKLDEAIVLVDAGGTVTELTSPVPQAYGLRFLVGGDLAVALPNAGTILRVTAGGEQSDLLTGLAGPNGLFPDLDGNLWVTEFAGARVLRVNPDQSVDEIVSGPEATSANGVIVDTGRGLLFYTNYQSGRIARVPLDDQGQPGAPAAVTMIPGAPDGLALDVCGNLYVVDQKGSALYRIRLDDAGVAIDGAELLATLPTNVANPHFGRGEGFDPESLYLAGNPGDVYRVGVGVAGIEIP